MAEARIFLKATTGYKTTAHLKKDTSTGHQPTHSRVVIRHAKSLGWNKLYAILVNQPAAGSEATLASMAWVHQCFSLLSAIDGLHPGNLTFHDLCFLFEHLPEYLPGTDGNQPITIVDVPNVDDTLASLGSRDLGDPYSPVDEPAPFYADTFFLEAQRAMLEGRHIGWWSPIAREAVPVGANGGAGAVDRLDRPQQAPEDEGPPGNWTELVIDSSHRLTYLGQDRLLDWAPSGSGTHYRVWQYNRSGSAEALAVYLLIGRQEWTTIDEGHELIWLGRDLRSDPHAVEDLVLDWKPATGDYRLYRVDLEGTKRDGTTPDILPEPPLAAGNWASIRADRKLIYLGGNRLLDWAPSSGDYRIWSVDRRARGTTDLLPTLAAQGNWESIRAGQQILNLGGDRILTWQPDTGWYRIWHYDRAGAGDSPPLGLHPLVEGLWQDIDAGHALLWMGGRHVLDRTLSPSSYRIRIFDRRVTSGDPLP